MPAYSENAYIQTLLENLVASYETEINYNPIEVKLDPLQIQENDIASLLAFVQEKRKRLFIFKLPTSEFNSNILSFTARRSVLNSTAETILSTSTEPKINPLKQALGTSTSTVRANIQIQKSFSLPKQVNGSHRPQSAHIEVVVTPNLDLIPIELPELPVLANQLSILGIQKLQDTAAQKIKEYPEFFIDGIVPGNLPKGFYIDKEKQALCYTNTPQRLPSALAPVLEKGMPLPMPTVDEAQVLLPTVEKNTLIQLLDTQDKVSQKTALITTLPTQAKEITSLLSSLKPTDSEFIIPLLSKLFILGGEAHTKLFIKLLKNCISKNLSIEFLNDPEAQDAFLNPRGIKNLQKLLQLPAEQREWWNKLAIAHLQNEQSRFNFNVFFEAYTQIFLPRIIEKNLTLPNSCPITHKGHILITLNRVLDVLEHAQNPQEQCLALADPLNWGATGVHYAMVQAPKQERFKQVAACMKIESHEDAKIHPEIIGSLLDKDVSELKPWLFRYMGQHWKTEIRLTDIQAQFDEIQTQSTWGALQKNQLLFILSCTFAGEATFTAENWRKTLKSCINLLQPLDENDRAHLLKALSFCFRFKPGLSLIQVQALIAQCIELKAHFPTKDFKNDILAPLFSALENEGPELINTLQERIQKTSTNNGNTLETLVSFTTLLQHNRTNLSTDTIRLLATLGEPELIQTNIDDLTAAIKDLKTKKDETYASTLLSLLGKINVSKSQTLPTFQQIQELFTRLADSTDTIPPAFTTPEAQEKWLKESIIEKNLVPGCVFGNGDISKLDDLIVEALVDAVKKRSSVLRIDKLKAALEKNLQSKLVPQQLKEQLNRELWPLFDALHELVLLLQTPNPKFEDILEKFRFFEQQQPKLLEANYNVGLIGQAKGEFLLSYILTGKRKEKDTTTGTVFAALLSKLYGLINEEIHAYFNDEQNRNAVTDLDAQTCLNWLAALNDTHSLTFLFKEELVEKKVLPALTKTLHQLNTQDPTFENTILDAAKNLDEDQPSNQALQNYKTTIEAIVSYLNFLIDLKGKAPQQFLTIYKQLSTGTLARLNYAQKQTLINNLLRANSGSLDLYLKLTTQVLEDNPTADPSAIDRALSGLTPLFALSDLEPESQVMFFKMSMSHNLRSQNLFPLETLNELKKFNFDEQTKTLLLKQIIQILGRTADTDSSDQIQSLIQQTQSFLTQNTAQASLCTALLKRVSLDNNKLGRDLNAYTSIISQLAGIEQKNREKVITILTGLANSKKDDSVNLPALLDITKGLGRRSGDLDQVVDLFATPPYPIAQALNSVLQAHGSEKLQAYCSSFDTNPFAKTGEARPLAEHFATNRIENALLSLKDLMHGIELPYTLQCQLARQLTYIETLGYTDPLNPNDYSELKKLTARSRHDLKERAKELLFQLRTQNVPEDQIEVTHLELLANLREIYFRTTGLFPNSTQMLMLLLSLHAPSANLLMRIKTGEGKSLITPLLAVLQWASGGTVDVCTANRTLLGRDYENSCEPFFKFLDIPSALIQDNSHPKDYQLNGINCSTLEDMALFRLAAKEAKPEALPQNDAPIHLVLDECDDALLDQTTLYKLVAENALTEVEDNPAKWIYPIAYQFINLPAFRNLNATKGKVWDEEEDLEQFRLYVNKEIAEKFNGDAAKQNFIMATSNTQLKQWINASCKAAKLIEKKHFIVRPIKEKDETGQEVTKKIVCIPLIRSTPKTGCIFTDGVQQALQARLIAENKDQAHYVVIDADPPVLASQSARGIVQFYKSTGGHLVGISGTPGDRVELQYLATQLGTQAIGVAPYAGDNRTKHDPVFTYSREETIAAIHRAIDGVKRPVQKPKLEFEPDISKQTVEEKEAFILEAKDAEEKWRQTQTQPILIVSEDFDDAQTIGQSFEEYKKAGFKIQIVTGKESSEELERIIKQAGRANTITIGTAMLARGIDINPGNHPQGLFVIQTYTDSKRMTTQIAGRAARNGKPGQWLPIYQVPAPESWFTRLIDFIFPSFRQRRSQQTIETLQTEIKLQATLDRLYTQAIDQAQQTLMQQIRAWENLLLELYPTDTNLSHELYQWRETLLSELTHAQETSITRETLESSIAEFQKAICKIWDAAKEEKWVAKAQKAATVTPQQSLRISYLKQLDLANELNIQSALQEKCLPFKEAAKALIHQNLETIILDKAGAVLEYTTPDEEEKTNLQLAQSKQLLPYLIGELCALYPEAVKKLNSADKNKASSFLPKILVTLAEKVIQQKNKALRIADTQQITQSIIQLYQTKLNEADAATIQIVLEKIKPLIFAYSETLAGMSLVDKFKIQGLILSFTKLYEQSGLPADEELSELQTSYNDNIMKMLADHLLNEFEWVKRSPQPIHAFLERTVAKEAALAIYSLAEEVSRSPQDQTSIQALYKALQEHRVKLQDKYLFSIRHHSPRDVINTALTAIESLEISPHCERAFRENCHDTVVSAYHLSQFRNCLEKTSSSFSKDDLVWEHLKNSLAKISEEGKNEIHLITELLEKVERYSTYSAYQPYRSALKTLKAQLTQSVDALTNSDQGLKQNLEDSLFTRKASQLATLLNVAPEQVRIQSGCDGIQTYIEIQVENASLQQGFTGYQSSYLPTLEKEQSAASLQKAFLEGHKEALLNLSDLKVTESLSVGKRMEFEKLFQLKALLDKNWSEGLDISFANQLPESVKSLYMRLKQFQQFDWNSQEDKPLGKDFQPLFDELFKEQAGLNEKLRIIRERKTVAERTLEDRKQKIITEEKNLQHLNEQLKSPESGILDKLKLNVQVLSTKAEISLLENKLTEPAKNLGAIADEERECLESLANLIPKFTSKTTEVISLLETKAKHKLNQYLQETSKTLIEACEDELRTSEATLEQFKQSEAKKSRYQTQRFFSTSELLRYEASLVQEESLIPPRPVSEKVQPTGFMRFFRPKCLDNPTPVAEELTLN
ncbi:helicase-related protein [Legionella cardiaca]|uniref:Protein translocase subunit SecA n=1 Tax=Legionella cardiaca TaxID=1071983 RepID=A0ABY8AZQ9_9GAMM|nr:helicase-related protein [Legionella cardiaca]WED44587.1 hypothetical protein PXX05_07305 [Legionella cardiaca]